MLEWMNERTVLSVQVLGRWYDFFWARFVKMDGREDGDGTCRQEIRECLRVWRRIADEGNDRRARDGYGRECMNACDFTII
jgi:hypothetical protein